MVHARTAPSFSRPPPTTLARCSLWYLLEAMAVDENLFFREATLRLCRHLRIEKGLQSCLAYLAQHMPADLLYLQKFEASFGAMRLIASATANEAKALDQLVALSPSALAAFDRLRVAHEAGELPSILVVNDAEAEPLTASMLSSLGLPPCSALALPLVVQGHVIGGLVLLAKGPGRFDDEAVRRFSSIREPFYVALSNNLEHAEVLELKKQLAEDNLELQRDLQEVVGSEIVGANFGLAPTMDLVRKVAPRDSPVLLLGETGTGKDVIAHAIHAASPRRAAPFVKVNCGAIPPTLIDSELFGHEKGAFTGAHARKRGRFERAHRGTLFLDEIGELPRDAQVRLLRVLQDHTIERVGGTEPVKVDVRILAATHRNLAEMIEADQFRQDLWYRLAVFPIEIPPLRRRTMDIPALASHLLSRKARALRIPAVPELAPGAIDALLDYGWPGNVRELENVIERALILDSRGPLRFDTLMRSQPRSPPREPRVLDMESDLSTLDAAITDHIRKVLEHTEGRVEGAGGAADVLRVHPSTLRSKMRKLGIAHARSSRTDGT